MEYEGVGMISSRPRVGIGMPVFNGENFIAEAIESFLTQTFHDFELIISDNASTDKTQQICREYAAKDQRIRFLRNKTNLGASRNFNRVFELSSGEYFKWAAHDDICAPEYLERCVEVLDRRPSVLICHPKTSFVDENAKHQEHHEDFLNLRSPLPHDRFRDYLFRRSGMCNAIFGVIRGSELKKTPLMGNYISSDRVLLAELILRGIVHQVPERLFLRRRHPQISWRANPTHDALTAWFDPARAGKIVFPQWRLLLEYLKSIRRAPLSLYERTWCNLHMVRWIRNHRRKLGEDFIRMILNEK